MRLELHYASRDHSPLEHVEPHFCVGLTVKLQMAHHLAREFDAHKAARGNDLLVSRRQLIGVERIIAVAGDHCLEIRPGVAGMAKAASESGARDLQSGGADISDQK